MRAATIAISLVLLTSCAGYRSVGGGDPVRLSIPLIWEDDDGRLRENLARKLDATGRFEYTSSSSRYQLIVKIEKDYTENIGYVWDETTFTNQRINRLYPSESQRTVTALVSVIDTATEEKVVKPFKITAQAEFDFVNPTVLENVQFKDAEGKVESTLQYSLGQLDSEEGARSESTIPLYALLAQKITEALVRIPLKI